jgi:hypothetical protein
LKKIPWINEPNVTNLIAAIIGLIAALLVLIAAILGHFPYQPPSSTTNNVEILGVANEPSNILYQTQNGTMELAAEKVRSTFTIKNNGPRDAFLKGLRIEELNRTFHPSLGQFVNITPDFEKAVVIESTNLYRDIPILYKIPPNEIGQFALVFSSNVTGGIGIWIKVTLIYDEDSEASETLQMSIQNYGYIIKAAPGREWLITPGG